MNFDNFLEGEVQCVTRKNCLEFGGDRGHVTLGLGLGLQMP